MSMAFGASESTRRRLVEAHHAFTCTKSDHVPYKLTHQAVSISMIRSASPSALVPMSEAQVEN